MYRKTKLTLVAAFVLGSASAVLAQADGDEFANSPYQLNPNAPVPVFTQAAVRQPVLIEGRNVGQADRAPAAAYAGTVMSDPTDRYPSFGGY